MVIFANFCCIGPPPMGLFFELQQHNIPQKTTFTVVCIGNFTARPGRKMSAVVGWVNVKDWSIPHLKALTVTFKLM